MTYTIKNLKETEDLAPKFGLSEMGEAHFPREDLQAQTVGLAFHVVKPGKRQSFAHRHEEAEEVYVVLSGSGRAKLDNEMEDLRAMDALRVSPKVARAFEAGPEGMELLVFGPRHAGDGEILKDDFWGDAAA
jgi:mannose-6-phosphate isomerase-like protein (cupin superfamily)